MAKLSMVMFIRQRAYFIYIYCSTAKSKDCQHADSCCIARPAFSALRHSDVQGPTALLAQIFLKKNWPQLRDLAVLLDCDLRLVCKDGVDG